LACGAPDVEDEAVSGKLLATLNPKNVAGFDVSPIDRNEAFDLASDHHVLDLLVVDFLGNLALAELKGEVSVAHEGHVDRERDDGEGNLDLIVLLRVQDQEEKHHREHVFEVES